MSRSSQIHGPDDVRKGGHPESPFAGASAFLFRVCFRAYASLAESRYFFALALQSSVTNCHAANGLAVLLAEENLTVRAAGNIVVLAGGVPRHTAGSVRVRPGTRKEETPPAPSHTVGGDPSLPRCYGR